MSERPEPPEVPADLQRGVFLTTLDTIYNWGRIKSMWPMAFGLACCAIEFMAMMAARFDLSRFGMEITRASPRQADLMFVSGTVTKKMVPNIVRLYNQMAEPKYVLAVGACATSGGPFKEGYNVVSGIDKYIPVDVYVPGCPPTPEAIIYGVMRIHDMVMKQSIKTVPWYRREPAQRSRAGAGVGARSVQPQESGRPASTCPGSERGAAMSDATPQTATETLPFSNAVPGAVTEVTPNGLVVAADKLCELATYLRDHEGYDYLSMVTSVDWPQYFEVVYYLYQVGRVRSGTAAKEPLVLKVRLTDKANPQLPSVYSIWPGARLPGARSLRHDGHPLHGAPEPAPDPPVGGVRGLSAAQGFQGALLRGAGQAVQEPPSRRPSRVGRRSGAVEGQRVLSDRLGSRPVDAAGGAIPQDHASGPRQRPRLRVQDRPHPDQHGAATSQHARRVPHGRCGGWREHRRPGAGDRLSAPLPREDR